MPGIARKLLIFASVNGLVVQAHGPIEHHRAVLVNYKSKQITDCSADESLKEKKQEQLEAHGLIGLLSIASSSFLIAITHREQVAQIFGKPVYVITDVAFLPLSSQEEASKVIRSAIEQRKSGEPATDSDLSDSEADDNDPATQAESTSSSPTDHERPTLPRSGSGIAQDVYAKRGQFGKFASQWLSRRGWAVGQAADDPQATTKVLEKAVNSAQGDAVAAAAQPDDGATSTGKDAQGPTVSPGNQSSVDAMLPKIIRSSRLILSSRCFFFSYDFDLTKRMGLLKGSPEAPIPSKLDAMYFWNKNLAKPLLEADQDPFLMPIMQGFVGQRAFIVKKPDSKEQRSASVVSVETPVETDSVSSAVEQTQQELSDSSSSSQPFLLTLISRRSTKRSGLRYLRRGIDDEGNCANAVETEQILSAPDWDRTRPIRSFAQFRASIPLFFSQSPYSFKPLPQLHQSRSANDAAFKRHFKGLRSRYGKVQISLLVDKHGPEVSIGNAYEETYKRLSGDSNSLPGVDFDWFDFHAECRGMKFENVSKLVETLKENLDRCGETVVTDGSLEKTQKGIVRTNCMDCLDRTNVVESALGQYMLQEALSSEGFEIDLVADQSTTWFNTLWADNGDAVSRQYAGTAALKGDFTRTRKRNMQGAMFDFSLTLTRYYNNMVNDYFSQAVIDVLLGNLPWRTFEDFESTMMSVDPGISVGKVRDHAIEICRNLVIQDETEDIIHGWTMLVPAHENTLRTLPFQEAVVLLTDAALYCCKFDWTTEKVASFEKVDLRSISKLRYGIYITSTFTTQQMDENMNVGMVVVYKPGRDSIIRTNTRSLQNYIEPESKREDRIDGGTGILSWLAPRSSPTSQALAIKVIPSTSDTAELQRKPSLMPLAIAEEICREVERAILGPAKDTPSVKDLVEEGDIISLAEAKKRTGYLEQIGHSIKKLVWT